TFDVYDGFEALAVGAAPATGTGVTWSPSSAVTAVSAPTRQGARGLQQQNFTATTGTFNAVNQGVLGGWLRRESSGPGLDDIYFYGPGGTLLGLAGLSSSGRLHYWDGTDHDTAVSWVPGAWYRVTVTFDASQRRFDVSFYDQTLTLLAQ